MDAVAAERGVFVDMNAHIEIAGHATLADGLALTVEPNHFARIHAGRHYHFNLLRLIDHTFAAAGRTGCFGHLAGAATALAFAPRGESAKNRAAIFLQAALAVASGTSFL